MSELESRHLRIGVFIEKKIVPSDEESEENFYQYKKWKNVKHLLVAVYGKDMKRLQSYKAEGANVSESVNVSLQVYAGGTRRGQPRCRGMTPVHHYLDPGCRSRGSVSDVTVWSFQ